MDSLPQIESDILTCTRCELRMNATAPVPGFGDMGAKYYILGEAPGREEDNEGVPFIGKSGRKLTELMALGGIDENDCYFANTCRCRPPKNRDPKKQEILSCREFIYREIALLKPQYIIAVGRYALGMFSDKGISKLHGTIFNTEINGQTYKVIAQYHPGACDRSPRLWATMLDDWEHMPEEVDHSYKLVSNRKKYPNFIALDTENNEHGGLGDWSVAFRDKGQLCVERFHGAKPDKEFTVPVVFHNAKWDLRVLDKAGMKQPENIHDTMIAAYCLGLGKQAPKDLAKQTSGSEMVGGLGLKYLGRRHLGMAMKHWADVKDHPEEIPEYNDADSIATFLLFEKWRSQLPDHYYTIDMPLLRVLMAMEDRGYRVDVNFLTTFAAGLDKRLAELDEAIPLNVHARAELQSYIYGTLGVEPWRFTDTGEPSVDGTILESIDDPLLNRIKEYKELYKDKGTYVDSYIDGRDKDDRVHPEFKQVSTATGRLSCANPNLQNVDKFNDMRKLFIPREGCKLIRMDWCKVEFGMLAVLAKDEQLIEAFLANMIHQITADALNVTYDTGKHINFLMQNGGTPWGMASTYGIPIDLAREYFAKYFAKFPAIGRHHTSVVELAKETKKVSTWAGRTRRLDALFAPDWRVRQQGENEAKTYGTQGGAAELIKLAMIKLHYEHRAPLILQVHDELHFEIPEKDALEYAHWLKEYVPTITPIDGVEFPVEVSCGSNWWECMQDEAVIK